MQGTVLTPDAGRGVIVSNRSLVLQRVARARAGRYACAARNSEGRAQSNLVQLRIKCKIGLCPRYVGLWVFSDLDNLSKTFHA